MYKSNKQWKKGKKRVVDKSEFILKGKIKVHLMSFEIKNKVIGI